MSMIEVVAKVCGAQRCIPPNPDREGYHWVRRFRGGPAIPLHWNPVWWRNADRGWEGMTLEPRQPNNTGYRRASFFITRYYR